MQSDDDVALEVEGLAGTFISVNLGSNTFTGSVDGEELDLEIIGVVSRTSGACEYTINGSITATQDGDTMSGRVEYRAATNDSPDCGTRQGCVTRQDFNASRPPAN